MTACPGGSQQAPDGPGTAFERHRRSALRESWKLADQGTAMLPLTPNGAAGALVIRAPLITAALREYFEMLWDRATPLKAERSPAPGDRLTPAQQTVLELMAEGLHDDAIARRAALSVTTVRRHVTAILQRLDVTTRFAAGAAAQRRGWIG